MRPAAGRVLPSAARPGGELRPQEIGVERQQHHPRDRPRAAASGAVRVHPAHHARLEPMRDEEHRDHAAAATASQTHQRLLPVGPAAPRSSRYLRDQKAAWTTAWPASRSDGQDDRACARPGQLAVARGARGGRGRAARATSTLSMRTRRREAEGRARQRAERGRPALLPEHEGPEAEEQQELGHRLRHRVPARTRPGSR